MSDQESNTIEESAEAGGSVEETQAAPAASTAEPTPAPTPAPAPVKKSSFVGWLALLLVLALAGGAAWLLPQVQKMEARLADRLGELEASADRENTELEAMGDRLGRDLLASLDELEQSVGSASSQIGERISQVEGSLAIQQEELSRFSASDRDGWLLAEAEYLLRLANQRLLMAGDTQAAQSLLANADTVLREIDDPRLHSVRAAIASDLAAVRAVPKLDVEGIYLRLAALAEQATQLKIFQMPERETQPREGKAEDWRARLQQGYAMALNKLSQYIIIRRRDVPMQALMDPQWEGLVRQNLRMLLEQAQVALLSGNQTLYAESLDRAQHWVDQFSDSDEAAALAIGRELRQLGDLTVAVPLPDISASAIALDEAIEQRAKQGGGE